MKAIRFTFDSLPSVSRLSFWNIKNSNRNPAFRTLPRRYNHPFLIAFKAVGNPDGFYYASYAVRITRTGAWRPSIVSASSSGARRKSPSDSNCIQSVLRCSLRAVLVGSTKHRNSYLLVESRTNAIQLTLSDEYLLRSCLSTVQIRLVRQSSRPVFHRRTQMYADRVPTSQYLFHQDSI